MQDRLVFRSTSGALSVLLAFAAVAASAEDSGRIDQLALADDPFEITDPHAADPGTAELSVVGIYERARRGDYRHTFALDTELQMGLAPQLELRLGGLGAFGNLQTRGRPDGSSAGRDGAAWGGSTRLSLLYQLSDGQGVVPLASVLGRLRTVHGPGTPSHEADAVLLLGKTLGSGPHATGINLNIGWTNRLAPDRGETPNQYAITAAIGRAVSQDAVVVLAYARRQQERHESDFSLLEVGLRYRPSSEAPTLGLAVGAGTNRDTPAFQVSLAAQWSFGAGSR